MVKSLKDKNEVIRKFAIKLKLKFRKELSKDRFLFETVTGERIGLILDESSAITALTKAVLLLRDPGASRIYVLLEKSEAQVCAKLITLLNDFVRKSISIIRKSEFVEISEISQITRKNISIENKKPASELKKFIDFAPKEIEIIKSKNKTTLCFLGLPFLSVEKKQIFFGIGNRKTLTENNFNELVELIENLKMYRNPDSPNTNHLFYRKMPERWLENVLKKNIKILNQNLSEKLTYNQVQLERRKIDLLALGNNGQATVIEIKIKPELNMLFQSLEYWHHVELARKHGLFDFLKPKPYKTVIYLVAPALSFHKEIDFLAKTVREDIEVYRFDINQDWRRELKVLQKRRLT